MKTSAMMSTQGIRILNLPPCKIMGITGLVLGLECRCRADIGDRPKSMEQLDFSGSDEAHTFFKSPDQEGDFLENDFSGARRSAPRRISPLRLLQHVSDHNKGLFFDDADVKSTNHSNPALGRGSFLSSGEEKVPNSLRSLDDMNFGLPCSNKEIF